MVSLWPLQADLKLWPWEQLLARTPVGWEETYASVPAPQMGVSEDCFLEFARDWTTCSRAPSSWLSLLSPPHVPSPLKMLFRISSKVAYLCLNLCLKDLYWGNRGLGKVPTRRQPDIDKGRQNPRTSHIHVWSIFTVNKISSWHIRAEEPFRVLVIRSLTASGSKWSCLKSLGISVSIMCSKRLDFSGCFQIPWY